MGLGRSPDGRAASAAVSAFPIHKAHPLVANSGYITGTVCSFDSSSAQLLLLAFNPLLSDLANG